MTELSVVLLLAVLGIAVSALLLRWQLGLPAGDATSARLFAQVREAAETFTRRTSGTVAALSALIGGALFLAYGLRAGGNEPISDLELGVWLSVTFALGAGGAIAVAVTATFVTARGAARTAWAARRSVDAVLRASLRGGASVALLSASSSVLTLGAGYVAMLAYHGAFGAEPAQALAIMPHLPLLSLGHAMGAGSAALLLQLAGGSFAKGADVGGDLGARDAGIDDDDAENPAVIANLAGDCVSGGAAAAASAFAAASIIDLGAMLGLSLAYAADEGLRNPLSVLLLPLLSRGFAILGTTFGVLAARTDDREDPASPLVRGWLVAGTMHAVGVIGAIEWLLPGKRAPLLAGALIGIAVSSLVVPLMHYATLTRFRPTREVADAARGGPTLGVVAGLGHGVGVALWPLIALGAGWVASRAAGAAWGGPSGQLLSSAGLLVGLVGGSTFLLALECTSSAVDAGSGLTALTLGPERKDVRGRLSIFESLGVSHRAAARAVTACAALPLSAVAIEVLLSEAQRRALLAGMTDSPPPWSPGSLLLGALLGALLVGAVAGRGIVAVLRAARRILEEVRRQMRDRPIPSSEERAVRAVDYASCCEMASRDALRLLVWPGLLTISLPALAIVGLRLLESRDKGALAVGSVASLIVAASVTGVLGVLFATGAGGAWGNAKKYIGTGAHGGRLLVDETGARAENPTFVASVIGDTVGDSLKDVAVPLVLILVLMLPLIALTLLPLLF